jgi:signal peptide peptidase SppA
MLAVKDLDLAQPRPTALSDFNGSEPWAIGEDALAKLLSSSEDALRRFTRTEPDALEAQRIQADIGSKRLGIRKDTAIVYVTGPLVKRETWVSQFLGLTTYETLFADIAVVAREPHVKSAVVYVDSPGGQAGGCDEVAKAIYALRQKKPVTAYVSSMGCSAAYWIASAAQRIVVSDMAAVGSIGVVLGIADYRKRYEASGVTHHQFISSRSPNKQADPATPQGQGQYQKLVDDMADVFVNAVAKYRGVSTATVTEKFGKGGVEIGANAVKAGLADEVGDFERVLASLQARPTVAAVPVRATTPVQPSAADLAREAAAAERRRVVAAEEAARQAAAAEAKRKADIDAMWKRTAEMVNSGMGPNAVKAAI